jgi:protein gp37
MKNSKIEWTNHTFNPFEGCTKVSPGCANCYAENRNARFGGGTAPNWGKGAPRRRTSVSNWNQPVKWNLEAATDAEMHRVFGSVDGAYVRPRVFCASLADWLDDEVPIEWLADLLDLIRRTPNLDWLLLTKRPQNWADHIRLARDHLTTRNAETSLWLNDWLPKKGSGGMPARDGTPPANVWIGTSVEDQTRADERIPLLLQIPAKVRFLSMEPLLGPVDLDRTGMNPLWGGTPGGERIHQVIVGGESGPNARPMNPDWARSLRDQCNAAGAAYFHKQNGEWRPFIPEDGPPRESPHNIDERWGIIRVGKKAAGRLLDGVEHNGFPGGAS